MAEKASIDIKALNKAKAEFLFEARDDDTLVAFGYEIKDWKNKLFWAAVQWYGAIMAAAMLVAICIYYDQKKEQQLKEEGKEAGMQKVTQSDDLEMTTDVNVTHF